jgi:hypothetical protein
MVDLDLIAKQHPKLTQEAAIEEVLKEVLGEGVYYLQYFKKAPFMKYYDGVQVHKTADMKYWGNVGIWLSIIQTGADLIDGNVKRFVKEAPGTVPDIPSDIVEELVDYTAKAGGRIGTRAKKWLQENIKPPYGSIKVYRGVKLDSYDVKGLTEDAQTYLGLSKLTDVHKGAVATLSRGERRLGHRRPRYPESSPIWEPCTSSCKLS